LFVNIKKYRNQSQLCDYKYYLQTDDELELIKIIENIKILISYGYKVKVRSHPRIDSSSFLKQYLENNFIEDFREVGIEESLANTKNVIGLYTTVLYQAYMNGINVILDDIVYKNYLSRLKSRDYIICSKPHLLLSEIIKMTIPTI
jgi:hypothetical protein